MRQAGGTDRERVGAIEALPDESFVLVGGFDETATFGPGEDNVTTLTSLGGRDGRDSYVARYNADGTLAWARRDGGEMRDEEANGAGFLGDGSVMVAGQFRGPATFGLGDENETMLDTTLDLITIYLTRINPNGHY